MAITIETEPNDISPVYSPVAYVVSSNNYTQTNFKFVAVVKNAAGTTIAKLKAPIFYGTTNYGVFDLSRILQNYVTYDFTQSLTTPAKCANSYIAYSVEFGEEYGGTEYLNLTSDTGKYCWNGLYYLYGSEQVTDYEIDFVGGSSKFLTRVRTRRVTIAQNDYLYFLRGDNACDVRVIAYDSAGSTTTSVINNTFDTTSDKSEYLLRVAAGPNNLNLIAQASLISGTSGSVVPANTSYYTVQVVNGSLDPGTEAYRFDVVEECSKYSPQYLYFLNPLGGFETVRCSMMSRDKYNVTRKQFKRNNYGISGVQYVYDTSKHGMTSYATEKTKQVVLNTNWLTETEFEWLQDLIASPVVFLGNIPVNITDTSYEVFDYIDGPNNLQITVEYTEPERLQNA
jgi:uncharacterized phage-like protein YoqJ